MVGWGAELLVLEWVLLHLVGGGWLPVLYVMVFLPLLWALEKFPATGESVYLTPYYSASLESSWEYWRVTPGLFVSHSSQDKEMIFQGSCITHVTSMRNEPGLWAWASTPAQWKWAEMPAHGSWRYSKSRRAFCHLEGSQARWVSAPVHPKNLKKIISREQK